MAQEQLNEDNSGQESSCVDRKWSDASLSVNNYSIDGDYTKGKDRERSVVDSSEEPAKRTQRSVLTQHSNAECSYRHGVVAANPAKQHRRHRTANQDQGHEASKFRRFPHPTKPKRAHHGQEGKNEVEGEETPHTRAVQQRGEQR